VATVVTRLSIDELRSPRSRRETYVGPWLPEPLLTDSRPDDESVSMALLVTLEALSPVERAVFLLHDVFDYGYDEIAEIVGKTRENCRQLGRPRAPPRRGPATALRALARAARGARHALLRGDPRGRPRRARVLLAEDAVATGDGGGKAAARKTPLHGGAKIARFMLGLMRLAERDHYEFDFREVNGRPGALIRQDGRVISALSLEIADGKVTEFLSVANPDKLHHLV
jgi:RNA polymerase sigma-70 factor (ECF subfamily)